MSTSKESEMMLCASCGTAAGDDIKLMKCSACHLVQYCSVKCQKDHWKQHKKECKKRAAELKDEILFKQPESTHLGDCPICCLPLSIDPQKSTVYTCCSKMICNGCILANGQRERAERLQLKCPFCREPLHDEEINKQRIMKRVEVNDPFAMCSMGTIRCDEGDYKAALKYWTKAVALGDAHAHHQLSSLYREGEGVEKNEKKVLHHLEEAAIGGHPYARHNLGCVEEENGRMDKAVKHFIIAAKLGCDTSLDSLKDAYKAGHASKEDFATALSGYQAANEATKSPQRDKAVVYEKMKAEYKKRGII